MGPVRIIAWRGERCETRIGSCPHSVKRLTVNADQDGRLEIFDGRDDPRALDRGVEVIEGFAWDSLRE